MKKSIVLLVVLSAFIYSGCATVQTIVAVQAKFEITSEPALKTVITKSIGENILVKDESYTVPVLNFTNDVPQGIIKSGIYTPIGTTSDKKFAIYTPETKTGAFIEPFPVLFLSGIQVIDDGLLLRNIETGDIQIGRIEGDYYKSNEIGINRNVNAGKIRFISNNIVANSQNYTLSTQRAFGAIASGNKGFLQKLIYTGKQGDTIKLMYQTQEFSADADEIAPAVNIEVTYDLKDSNEITFKAAKIKVIEATNNSITYEVLKNFD